MSESDAVSIVDLIEKLCGQKPEPHDYVGKIDGHPNFPSTGMGHSQLNELLLSLHLDRTSQGFFEYFFKNSAIPDVEDFANCITEFRKTAILAYGNIKFAFKRLSQMIKEEIEKEIGCENPTTIRDRYAKRHDPLIDIKQIEPKETYYLGYITEREIKEKRDALKELGQSLAELFNHHCYMDYDHMDVYVATSMREKSDFWNVAQFVSGLFAKPELKELKLRYFDPTQAYCPHRIDKGLSEALMLKRACCAIYIAGETDTLGKDSELAVTLAQGKPVVVYVPKLEDYDMFKKYIVDPLLENVYPDDDKVKVALKFLKTYAPDLAWTPESTELRKWIEGVETPEFESVLRLVLRARRNSMMDALAHCWKRIP